LVEALQNIFTDPIGGYIVFAVGFGMVNEPITNTAVSGLPRAGRGDCGSRLQPSGRCVTGRRHRRFRDQLWFRRGYLVQRSTHPQDRRIKIVTVTVTVTITITDAVAAPCRGRRASRASARQRCAGSLPTT